MVHVARTCITLFDLISIFNVNEFERNNANRRLSELTLVGAGETKGKSKDAKGKSKGGPKGQAPSNGKGKPIQTFCSCSIFLFVLCCDGVSP